MRHITLIAIFYLISFVSPMWAADGAEISAGLSHEVTQNNQQVNLFIVFDIEEKKHIGAVYKKGFGQKTEFKLSGLGYDLKGKLQEPKVHEIKDPYIDEPMWVHEGKVVFKQSLIVTDIQAFNVVVQTTGQICDDMSCIPFDETILVSATSVLKGVVFESHETKSKATGGQAEIVSEGSQTNTQAEMQLTLNGQSLMAMFWAGIIGGLIALITPCVFPMIPITVSYFLKQSGDDPKKAVRLATVYSIGIIFMFTGLGLALTKFIGAAGANWLAVNPWINLFIGLVFLLFAFSFLGAFDLQPPNWMLNASMKSSRSGGYVGTLFMGLTFAVTSFTCTAPVVGSQLAIAAQTGHYLAPTVTMLGFSGVIAVVFFGLSLFPSMLQNLPKSGGWLGSVKVVLGFIELALALKFIRVTDVRWHWDFLSHDMVLAMWVAIGLMMTLYLAGLIRLKHDSPLEGLSVTRLMVTMTSAVFSIYLAMGLTGTNLSGNIEAFLGVDPPGYTGWKINHSGGGHQSVEKVIWHSNYDEALKVAQLENKPLFIDFTGNSCVNCIKMEKGVFPHVEDSFEQFVCVKLLTDLNTPETDRWQKMQVEKYQDAALPLYVIETPQGKLINKTSGMHSIEDFRSFLEASLTKFKIS